MTTLIISNEEMDDDNMKIIKSLEESGLLITGVTKKSKNKTKYFFGFLGMFFDTLICVSLLRNL